MTTADDKDSAYRSRLTALAIAYEANVPVIAWGVPGQGKSTLLEAFARRKGVPIEVIIASIREPTDFNGLPILHEQGTTVAPPDWVLRLKKAGRGIAFFDEISNAPPAVRAAVLRGFDGARTFGSVQLPAEVRLVCAANPPEIAEDGWELGAPMANRLFHIRDWELPASVVIEGLRQNRWPDPPEITFVDLDRCLTWGRTVVAGYLRSASRHLTVIPAGTDRQYGWPTPRTWEMCARLLAYGRAARLNTDAGTEQQRISDDVRSLLVEGSIGAAVGPGFVEWIATLSLPRPDAVLADPTCWTIPQDRGDVVMTGLTSVMDALAARPTKASWINAGRLLAMVVNAQYAEVAAVFFNDWITLGRQHDYSNAAPSELVESRELRRLLDMISNRLPSKAAR